MEDQRSLGEAGREELSLDCELALRGARICNALRTLSASISEASSSWTDVPTTPSPVTRCKIGPIEAKGAVDGFVPDVLGSRSRPTT